jgi:hypothetical protein
MKITSILLGLVLSSTIFAGVPKGCPYTRSCTEDANCKLYALKHNCVGTCVEKQMKNLAQNVVSCPGQCLCQKLEEVKA